MAKKLIILQRLLAESKKARLQECNSIAAVAPFVLNAFGSLVYGAGTPQVVAMSVVSAASHLNQSGGVRSAELPPLQA
jgi:hypothetical protein